MWREKGTRSECSCGPVNSVREETQRSARCSTFLKAELIRLWTSECLIPIHCTLIQYRVITCALGYRPSTSTDRTFCADHAASYCARNTIILACVKSVRRVQHTLVLPRCIAPASSLSPNAAYLFRQHISPCQALYISHQRVYRGRTLERQKKFSLESKFQERTLTLVRQPARCHGQNFYPDRSRCALLVVVA